MEPEPSKRRLAAILAADVVGYSRLMGEDEAGTLAALKAHRQGVFDPAVARNNGRIFKLIGDGTLVEFASVVDAVRCAKDIQTTIAAADGQASVSPPIRLRIGVNLGDVIFDGEDVYGDGVNVAARIEPLAEAGGLCVSSIVKESVGDRLDIAFSDGGEVELKNIARPLRVWRWQPDAPSAGQAVPGPATSDSEPTPSVAVLPFDNMSGDPEQEYFSDGISEDIITDLSKVGGLTVIARNSSFAYKGQSVDLRAVGRELGATNILEGSVRRAGNRVRITAQLIDAATGRHQWADRFDRDLTDIFEVQDEVTTRIVEALKVTLSPAEKDLIAAVATRNADAHDAYLRVREMIAHTIGDRDEIERGFALIRRAIDADPGFAAAHAVQSMLHSYDHLNRWSAEADTALERAVASGRKAVELDRDEYYAHYALSVALLLCGDRDGGTKHTDEVLRLAPNYAAAHNARGVLALQDGKVEDAIEQVEKAIRLDPASNQFVHFLGLAHLMAHNFETAAATLRHRTLLFPKTDISRALLAAALGHLGNIDDARQAWADMLSVNPDYDLDQHMSTVFFARPADEQTVREGLAKAGLP